MQILNIRKLLGFFISSFCLISLSPGVTIDDLQLAIDDFDESAQKQWSFVMEEQSKEKTSTILFEPIVDGEGPVILKSVNGNEPSEEDLKEFQKEHEPRKPKSESKEKGGTFDVVVWETLELKSTDEDSTVFTFTPNMVFGGEAQKVEEIEGTLVYDNKGKFIKSIQMRTLKPFKPDPKVKIKKMDIQKNFQRMEDGTILPESILTKVSGKALLVVKIDEDVSIRFSDYKRTED